MNNKDKNKNIVGSYIYRNENYKKPSGSKSPKKSNTKNKKTKYDEVRSAVKSKKKSINPVWNVQLGIDQVAELNAIQSLKKLSSRTEALKLLLKFAKDNSFLKNESEKSLFKSSVRIFLYKHRNKAIKQYRKYHEK